MRRGAAELHAAAHQHRGHERVVGVGEVGPQRAEVVERLISEEAELVGADRAGDHEEREEERDEQDHPAGVSVASLRR